MAIDGAHCGAAEVEQSVEGVEKAAEEGADLITIPAPNDREGKAARENRAVTAIENESLGRIVG